MFQKRPLAAAVHAAIVFAAAQSAMAAEPADATDPGVEEIVVTGSRIQRANEVSSSPVVQLDAQQFQFTGSPRVEDTVRSLPQVYMDQDSGQSIESDGTATLQLRNLGDIRTLVLIDGKRLPTNFNGGASVQTGPDLNTIPVPLVNRVEVLTGGASAAYGSDAVAGVVNFTMKDDFEGVSFDVPAQRLLSRQQRQRDREPHGGERSEAAKRRHQRRRHRKHVDDHRRKPGRRPRQRHGVRDLHQHQGRDAIRARLQRLRLGQRAHGLWRLGHQRRGEFLLARLLLQHDR